MTLDGKIDPDLDADADDLNLTVAIRRLVDPPRISAHEPIRCNDRGYWADLCARCRWAIARRQHAQASRTVPEPPFLLWATLRRPGEVIIAVRAA